MIHTKFGDLSEVQLEYTEANNILSQISKPYLPEIIRDIQKDEPT